MNPILARTAAGLRAIRVARWRARRVGHSSDLSILAACRAYDWHEVSERRARLTIGRISKGGLN